MSVQMKLGSGRLLKAASICVLMISPLASGELLFEENFDKQSDWHSGMEINDRGGWPNGEGPDQVQCVEDGHILPEGWDCARQDPAWAPSVGHPDRHENMEILLRNVDRARGGSGKSLVIWRDSTTGPQHRWNSDGILSKFIPSGKTSLFVEFWIRFSERWTPFGESGATKLFRISSWDGSGTNLYGFGGKLDNAPIVFWDYEHNKYGLRNKIAMRADPQETNYKLTQLEPGGLPRNLTNGSFSLNFTSNIRDFDGDGIDDNTISRLLNFTDGQPVGKNNEITSHDQFYGSQWRKVAFYVRMNSSAGVKDGVLKQWIDGQLIFSNSQIPWMGPGSPGDRKWNVVHFGGNSHFHAYPDEDRREEWYSIDDIVIRTDIPKEYGADANIFAPNPPIELHIE